VVICGRAFGDKKACVGVPSLALVDAHPALGVVEQQKIRNKWSSSRNCVGVLFGFLTCWVASGSVGHVRV
jgi:hypothetical protein